MYSNMFQILSSISDDISKNDKKPWLTRISMAIIVVIFIGINITNRGGSIDGLSKWGWLSSYDIWNGRYWSLLTSVFVHTEIWHVASNLFWFYVFSTVLEMEIGKKRWAIFFILSAFVSSGFQLAISYNLGIGMSGVVYAMFGFLFYSRNQLHKFTKVISPKIVILMFTWLIGCLIVSTIDLLQIGNAAHISGLIFGVFFGMIYRAKPQKTFAYVSLTVMIGFVITSLFYCPWSYQWVSKQAFDAGVDGDYDRAIPFYLRSLELGQDPEWVWESLTVAHWSNGNIEEYKEALHKLKQINSEKAKIIEESTGLSDEE